MNDYNLVISGVIGSVITLLITAIIDFRKEKYRSKMEMKRMVFQRQTDAAERAMAWYQEGIDSLRMLKMACDEVELDYNSATWMKFVTSSNKMNKLYDSAGAELNPIYLYFDFSMIEEKNNSLKSMMYINYALTEIGKFEQQILNLKREGVSDDSNEIVEIYKKAIFLLKEMSKAIDDQINSMVESQFELRKYYMEYK